MRWARADDELWRLLSALCTRFDEEAKKPQRLTRAFLSAALAPEFFALTHAPWGGERDGLEAGGGYRAQYLRLHQSAAQSATGADGAVRRLFAKLQALGERSRPLQLQQLVMHCCELWCAFPEAATPYALDGVLPELALYKEPLFSQVGAGGIASCCLTAAPVADGGVSNSGGGSSDGGGGVVAKAAPPQHMHAAATSMLIFVRVSVNAWFAAVPVPAPAALQPTMDALLLKVRDPGSSPPPPPPITTHSRTRTRRSFAPAAGAAGGRAAADVADAALGGVR